MNTDAVTTEITDAIAGLESELIEIRRDIHRHPELSWQETRTTRVVASRLEQAGIAFRPLDSTGLVVDLGSQDPVLRVGLRGDLDALALMERSGLEFSSRREGVTHACGHDVHTTGLLGAALALKACESRLLEQRIAVRLFFQPAEEVMPGGAEHVVRGGFVDDLDCVFALHCDPQRDVGEVGVRTGPITAASDTVTVSLSGSGGHTSRPFLTQDLTYALGKIVTEMPAVLSRRVDPRAGALLVWGAVRAGDAPNVIPSFGKAVGTLRVLDATTWKQMPPLLAEVAQSIVAPYQVEAEINHVQGVPPVVNTTWGAETMRRATTAVLGAGGVGPAVQSLGGEDFAWMLLGREGALGRLGTRTPGGKTYDLHQGDLVIDERAVAIAAKVYAMVPFAAFDTQVPELND